MSLTFAPEWTLIHGTLTWVCERNGVMCLILRGVTDLVGVEGGEAYEDYRLFVKNTREVMKGLVEGVGDWVKVGGLGK
jgi:nucleoside phosphorylase